MRVGPSVESLKMRVVVVSEKDGSGKLVTQRTQDHHFIVDIRAEQANRANTVSILSFPSRIVLSHLVRQPTEIVGLVQSFRRLYRDVVLTGLKFLLFLTLIVLAGVAWQPSVNSTKIMIRVYPGRRLCFLLDNIFDRLP